MKGGLVDEGCTGSQDSMAGGDSRASDDDVAGEDSDDDMAGEDSVASDDAMAGMEQDMDELDTDYDTDSSGTDSEREKIETEIASELYDELNNYSIAF